MKPHLHFVQNVHVFKKMKITFTIYMYGSSVPSFPGQTLKKKHESTIETGTVTVNGTN